MPVVEAWQYFTGIVKGWFQGRWYRGLPRNAEGLVVWNVTGILGNCFAFKENM